MQLAKTLAQHVPLSSELADPRLGLLTGTSGSAGGPHLQALEIYVPVAQFRSDGLEERPAGLGEVRGGRLPSGISHPVVGPGCQTAVQPAERRADKSFLPAAPRARPRPPPPLPASGGR